MKRRLLAVLLALAMMSTLIFGAMPIVASAADEEPTDIAGVLDIDLDENNKGPEISQDLIGLFFEDINYGADGGLYAELVQNRSFEYYYYNRSANSAYHTYSWSAVDGATFSAISDGTGMNANNTYFARVITNGANQGIANTGWTRESTSIASVTATTTYDTGIYLEEGKFYDFSMWVKGPVATDITAQVVIAGTSDVVGTVTIPAGSATESGWQKLEGVIEATATTLKGSLQVLFAEAGTYDVDFVSLFPQHTYNNRKNGLRADMVQILKDVNPGILRFPGGCVVEGNSNDRTMNNRYQWKLSVGPVEERKTNWNRWQAGTNRAYVYHQSLGLGFFEYMCLAEDIGAKAVPVLNCGMGCQFEGGVLVPLDQLQPYIDDALDWIEFCNGDPATNEWAALRAEMGHPEPFGLEYLAIGNEQWGSGYYPRYDMFQEQIAAKYPEIKLLSTTGPDLDSTNWNNAKAWLADKDQTHSYAYDEHYYISEDAMLNTHFDRYSNETKYPRTEGYPFVFAGEYACHSGSAPTRAMTLRQALVEAAYMTTFEKNADIVKLTAYAPLFGKEDHIQWNPNLIYAANHYVYGQPSYWTQWMYGTNLGTYQLKNQMSEYDPDATPEEPTVKYEKGTVGIGTWKTSAEFRNLKVTDNETGAVLLEDALTALDGPFYGNSANHATAGTWSIAADGQLAQTSTSAENVAKIYAGGYDWKNYTYEVEAMKTGGAEGFLFPFLYASGSDYYWFNVAGWSNAQSCIEKGSSTTSRTQPAGQVAHSISNNVWYKFKMEVTADLSGNTYKCYINDQLFQTLKESTNTSKPTGTYAGIYNSASYDEDANEIIVKLINYNSAEKTVKVNLNNYDGYINPTGRVIQFGNQALSSANNGNNQLNVSAHESTYTGFAKSFNYTLPRYSFVTLRIPTVAADKYVESIDTANVTTTEGVTPKLPATVKVNYADGSSETKAVKWEIKPDCLYDIVGTYEVLGEVDGTKLDAKASVQVTEGSKIAVASYSAPLTKYGKASNANQWVGRQANALHLAYTTDGGKTWEALNGGNMVLTYAASASKTSSNSKQFTDPYIFQKDDGSYVLLATALRYNQAHSDTSIVVWDSEDMVTWKNQRLVTLGSAGVYPVQPEACSNGDGTYTIVWKQYNTENTFCNIIADDFRTVQTATAYTGTDYPQVNSASVKTAGMPEGTVGSIVTVDQETLDALLAAYGTPNGIPTGTEDVTVETNPGVAPTLPTTATINLTGGDTKEGTVVWEEIDPAKYATTGSFTVQGYIEGTPNYVNPFHKNGGDPDIFKGPDGYYYYTSSYMDPANSGNAEYQYDRVNIRRAKTIAGLEAAEDRTIFWRKDSGVGSYHLWAPEIHYVQFAGEEQGTWVVYFAAAIRGNQWNINNYALVCDSQDPMTGNWTDLIPVAAPNKTSNFELDATVFEHNGKWYRISASKPNTSNLVIAELTSLTTVGNQVTIATPSYNWENSNDRVLEGPTVMKANGLIYLCYAAGSTDSSYMLGCMTAIDSPDTDLMDPASWTKMPYPIMTSETATEKYGPGHATFSVAEDGVTPILSYMTRPTEAYNNNPLYVANRWARVALVYFHENGNIFLADPPADGYLPGSYVTATVNVVAEGDQALVEDIANRLDLPNKDNVKGNITLPTSMDGATITWASSNEAVISTATKVNENYDDGPAGFVTRQAADTKVTLTATITYNNASTTKEFEMTVKKAVKATTAADRDYYLEMYFTDSTHDIFFATAEDGFNFQVINNNKPMFSTQGHTATVSQVLGDLGLRDPFMMRSKEGDKYYILATDLNASGGNWNAYATQGSDSLVIYESDDLVNWSQGRLTPIATDPDFGCTWAPEVSYDEMTGEYLVYYSLHSLSAGRKQIYYSKTRDFITFTEPKVWVPYFDGRTTGVIDTTCYYDEANNTYYRFTKDESNNRPFVDINVGGNLLDDNWVRGTGLTISGTGNYALEGQNMYQLHPNDVPAGYSDTVLLIDEYSGTNRGFVPFVTKGLSATEPITFEIAPDYTKPAGAKHGNVIPVSKDEYDALMEAYGPTPIPDVDISTPVAYYSFDDEAKIGASADGANDLTEVNTPAYTAEGIHNGAAYLAGGAASSTTAPYFQFPAGMTSKDVFTLAGWFKVENNAQWARMIDIGGGQGNTMFLTNRDGDSALHLDLNISNSYDSITTNSIATGEWAHIAIVVDGENYSLYVNSKLAGSAPLGSRKLSALDGLKSYIGKSQYSDSYFNGWVDELYFYDKALSPNNIKRLMNRAFITGGEEYILADSIEAGKQYVITVGGKAIDANGNAVDIEPIDTSVYTDDSNIVWDVIYNQGENPARGYLFQNIGSTDWLCHSNNTFSVKADPIGTSYGQTASDSDSSLGFQNYVWDYAAGKLTVYGGTAALSAGENGITLGTTNTEIKLYEKVLPTEYCWTLADKLESNGKYLIVSANAEGAAKIMTNTNRTIGTKDVEIKKAEDGTLYIDYDYAYNDKGIFHAYQIREGSFWLDTWLDTNAAVTRLNSGTVGATSSHGDNSYYFRFNYVDGALVAYSGLAGTGTRTVKYSNGFKEGSGDNVYLFKLTTPSDKEEEPIVLDWTAYDEAVAAADAVKADEAKYTAESYAEFIAALPAAIDKDTAKDQSVVDEATAAINAAIAKLVEAPAAPEISVVADKDVYVINDIITLTIKTAADAEKIGVFNENGKGISKLSCECVETENGKTWTVTVKVATKGERSIFVKAAAADQSFADVENLGSVSFTALKEALPETEPVKPEIISIDAPETAVAKQAFTFTVKTSKAVANIAVLNENGAGISIAKTSVDEGDARVWTVTTTVGSSGARTFKVVAAENNSEWIESTGTTFAVKIAKQ